MIGSAGQTELDLHFSVFRIPVRVHPLFWLMACFISWGPDPKETLLGVACVFFSILIHELGHAVVLRYYNWPSEIVLYGMGGFATSTSLSTWRSVFVSFAGPLAQFILLGLTITTGLVIEASKVPWGDNQYLQSVLSMLFFINLFWPILNLMPVFPLDGGQIVSALCNRYLPRFQPRLSIRISILVAGLLALLGYQIGATFLMFMFGYMCAINVMQHNEVDQWQR